MTRAQVDRVVGFICGALIVVIVGVVAAVISYRHWTAT